MCRERTSKPHKPINLLFICLLEKDVTIGKTKATNKNIITKVNFKFILNLPLFVCCNLKLLLVQETMQHLVFCSCLAFGIKESITLFFNMQTICLVCVNICLFGMLSDYISNTTP